MTCQKIRRDKVTRVAGDDDQECGRPAQFEIDDAFISHKLRCAKHAASAVRAGFDVIRISNCERITRIT